MIKVLERVYQDDQKAKEIFEKKLAYLEERKNKALENRRSTLKRKNRKRVAEPPSKGMGKNKRAKAH